MERVFILTFLIFFSFNSFAIDFNMSDFHIESQDPQKFYLINRGPEAFNLRIKLIREATKYIHMEYYLFTTTISGRLLLQELVQKADEGIEVKLIVDGLSSKSFITPELVKVLAEHKIEVKYYNDAFPLNPIINHRDHRKILIIDGEKVLMGGRNISDEYFEMASEYNFYDRDILVEGNIAGSINQSFMAMWGAKIVQPPKKENLSKKEISKARILINEIRLQNEYESNQLEDVLATPYTCTSTEFISEFPIQPMKKQKRNIKNSFLNKISDAKYDITMESPYLVIDKEMHKYFIRQNNVVDFKILTNSLISNDQVIAYNGFIDSIKKWINAGVKVYALTGDKIYNQFTSKRIFGTHAKTYVFDEMEAFIGSYNFDPRSENINVEAMIGCNDSPEFAQAVKKDILNRSKNSLLLSDAKKAERILREGASFYKRFLSDITRLPARLIKVLL